MTVHRIKDWSYFRDIYFVQGKHAELDRWVKKLGPDFKGGWTNGLLGKWIFIPASMSKTGHDTHYIVIHTDRSSKVFTMSALGHEVLHLTFAVLNNAGITYCDQSEEAFTYYFQYIFAECLRRFKMRG